MARRTKRSPRRSETLRLLAEVLVILAVERLLHGSGVDIVTLLKTIL